MNYAAIANRAKAGIAFFSDGNGTFRLITGGGGVEIVGGVEVEMPEESTEIKGLIRAPRVREVDGETIRVTDKLGVFNADVEIRNGNFVDVDGERYVVVEARPIRPTGQTVAYRPILRRVAVHG
nr:MAG TPA: head tail attachment [Caudoviricetes sp.]